jgi:hypothetical protein
MIKEHDISARKPIKVREEREKELTAMQLQGLIAASTARVPIKVQLSGF